jgi:hypothetical protein
MFNRVVNVRWLVVPLTAFFLLFTGGAAVAPDCHIESTSQTNMTSAVVHDHPAGLHSHSHQSTSSAVSNAQTALFTSGNSLNNEICFIIGFLVLLLLRYVRLKKPTFTFGRLSQARNQLPLFLSRNLGYLNLTHLKLGIIRI